MAHEVELLADAHGLAVFGEPGAVELFLRQAGVPSRELDLSHLAPAVESGSQLAQTVAEAATQSGRWVKLTEESAEALKSGALMRGSREGSARAILTDNGKISEILEIVSKPGAMLANPAVLAGAAGIMAQLAMQQSMEEITAHLRAIDEKCDDILRAQKDAQLAELIGVGAVIDEVYRIRTRTGRVSAVNWSKVQDAPQTIYAVEAYALRQLERIEERLGGSISRGSLPAVIDRSGREAHDWLVVLARCWQLLDAHTILELDRVAGTDPDSLTEHGSELRASREERRARISGHATAIVLQIHDIERRANRGALVHPRANRELHGASKPAIARIRETVGVLGGRLPRSYVEERRWRRAAADAGQRIQDAGVRGAGSAARAAEGGYEEVRAAGERLIRRLRPPEDT